MDPKQYYYERFREHFEQWIKKSQAHPHGREGVYVPIHNLRPEYLSHIPADDYFLFHYALACTVLIDQVMYTHFKRDYRMFQKMTMYPKIEYGITSVNISPWAIVHGGIGLKHLQRFIEFFVEDLKQFFTSNKFEEATWGAVRMAMLADQDVVNGVGGPTLRNTLEIN